MADEQRTIGLFMAYVGGHAGSANIELHDLRFVAGHGIEDTFPALRLQRFGEPQSLHLDSYVEVRNVDGYCVLLTENPVAQQARLYEPAAS